ncbi:DNA primase [Enterobacteriaceae endosymbiont of Neohaemonia nigricornis]|uniref:DNA primase n=1 Tax=Enterobacteriaceae endosymbiont of Neohaemonia nigricornis TaxID=2675792 RepID=UPI0014494119|nr:DNA primase [Enterobacteriaceae endosymbiont of Neohaemonia nigricornis]QJC30428.1 DNA primase [Enterobacteriaceae endosymbiont of Neohaemonia nigricornis]
MKYVSRDFINNILEKSDIIIFIKSKIKLNKKGNNFFGLCPFHIEKTPSFAVNADKQIYHCFGCGVHGNIIDFIINYNNVSFLDSIKQITDFFNIPIDNYNNNVSVYKYLIKHDKLYRCMQNISNFYENSLYTSAGKNAYNYLLNRGYTLDIIKFFSIGYSPIQSEYNIKNNSKYLNILSQKLGILKINKFKKLYYDIFNHRIIFPIKNIQGYIIGFGARAIDNKHPKYLNSSENLIFHKSNELYGLYEIKKKNNSFKYILVVEGYTDVISLFQYNITYVVAVLGTNISNVHIKKLFCLTNMIIYCYDGDHAGIQAHWHALKISLSHMVYGKKIGFMILPNNEDPDSLIRKEGKKLFEERIKNVLLFSDFFFKFLLSTINTSSCEGKTKLTYTALSLIKIIPDYLFQVYLIKQLGEKIGIMNLIDIYYHKSLYSNINNYIKKEKNILKKTTVRLLISILIQYPYLSNIVPPIQLFKTSNIHGLSFFIKLIKVCSNENITTQNIIEYYKNTKFKQSLEILAKWNHMIPNNQIEELFIQLINKLKINILEDRQNYLISLERQQGLSIKQKNELWSLNKKIMIKNI